MPMFATKDFFSVVLAVGTKPFPVPSSRTIDCELNLSIHG